MKTFRIQCEYKWQTQIILIAAPTELDAIDRAFDLCGVQRAHSLGATDQPATVPQLLELEHDQTQEQSLNNVLAQIAAARDNQMNDAGARRINFFRRQAK